MSQMTGPDGWTANGKKLESLASFLELRQCTLMMNNVGLLSTVNSQRTGVRVGEFNHRVARVRYVPRPSKKKETNQRCLPISAGFMMTYWETEQPESEEQIRNLARGLKLGNFTGANFQFEADRTSVSSLRALVCCLYVPHLLRKGLVKN
jgi:hypothetical protein